MICKRVFKMNTKDRNNCKEEKNANCEWALYLLILLIVIACQESKKENENGLESSTATETDISSDVNVDTNSDTQTNAHTDTSDNTDTNTAVNTDMNTDTGTETGSEYMAPPDTELSDCQRKKIEYMENFGLIFDDMDLTDIAGMFDLSDSFWDNFPDCK